MVIEYSYIKCKWVVSKLYKKNTYYSIIEFLNTFKYKHNTFYEVFIRDKNRGERSVYLVYMPNNKNTSSLKDIFIQNRG